MSFVETLKDKINKLDKEEKCFICQITKSECINEHIDFKDKSEPVGMDALTATLMQFNYWLPSYNYTNDISPMEGVFNLLFELVKDKRDLIEFWNSKKAEITDSDNPTDLNTQIKRWLNGNQRPTWKHIKLFLDEELLPKESMVKDQISEEFSTENLYLIFRRRVFPSCFITKFFDSLENQNLIHEQSRNMIRNGIRLFYKRMLVDGGTDFSIEENMQTDINQINLKTEIISEIKRNKPNQICKKHKENSTYFLLYIRFYLKFVQNYFY